MSQPPSDSAPSAGSREQHLREALALLEAVGIAPLTRPRALAAARALGYALNLPDWYAAAWELEQAGAYTRHGDGDTEWLDPQHPITTPDVGASPLHARPWLAGALRAELERMHDNTALRALAAVLEYVQEAEAEHCLRDVCATDPDDIEALIALARILERRGDFVHARKHVEHALRLAPENLEGQVLLANILDGLQLRTLARERYQRAIELAPSSAVAHYNYGVLLLRDGQRDEAERNLRLASELSPDDGAMLTTLAVALIDRGEAREGGRLLRRALALNPNNARARRHYGMLLARMQRMVEARVELLAAVALRPDDTTMLLRLCALLDELDAHEEAVTFPRGERPQPRPGRGVLPLDAAPQRARSGGAGQPLATLHRGEALV